MYSPQVVCFFFFNDTATTEIYTLSLHDALPISAQEGGAREHPREEVRRQAAGIAPRGAARGVRRARDRDRKSTRLNSSHANISYAVFCLKKKKKATYLPQSRNEQTQRSDGRRSK